MLLELGAEMDEDLAVQEINILEDPALYARYRHKIPVIAIDPEGEGPSLFAPITQADLRRALTNKDKVKAEVKVEVEVKE
jgi:hypothetical protein